MERNGTKSGALWDGAEQGTWIMNQDRQTDRQTDRQIDRQTGVQRN